MISAIVVSSSSGSDSERLDRRKRNITIGVYNESVEWHLNQNAAKSRHLKIPIKWIFSKECIPNSLQLRITAMKSYTGGKWFSTYSTWLAAVSMHMNLFMYVCYGAEHFGYGNL